MVELADTLDLGSSAARCVGSSPTLGTNLLINNKLDSRLEFKETPILNQNIECLHPAYTFFEIPQLRTRL